MPRRRIRAVRSAAAVRYLAGGLFISRLLHPSAAAAAAGPMLALVPSPGEDRENNTPPPTTGQQQQQRRTLLPAWFPRAPLQDITALVNVLEMRRAQTRAALAQQRNLNTVGPRQVSLLARLSDLPPSSILPADTGITPLSQSLWSSMKEIEQATKDYVKDKVPDEAAAAAAAKRTRTLMSMR